MLPLRASLGLPALVALLCAGPAAATSKAPSIYQSKLLWATVNVCDTPRHPDTVGVRASMPGSGIKGEEMFIRFQLQYYVTSDNSWHNLGKSGDSGFIDAGSARYKARQTGRNFVIRPPANGSSILRGAVTFEWRKAGNVTRRARKRTRSNHPGTMGADPPGFSAATCTVQA